MSRILGPTADNSPIQEMKSPLCFKLGFSRLFWKESMLFLSLNFLISPTNEPSIFLSHLYYLILNFNFVDEFFEGLAMFIYKKTKLISSSSL